MCTMPYYIRKATKEDLPALWQIYDAVLKREEDGIGCVGWVRGIYPTEQTLQQGLDADDLFLLEHDGRPAAVARINRQQMQAYLQVDWQYKAPAEAVLVLHTLAVDPAKAGYGLGTTFVRFYEQEAVRQKCRYLRMDTNARNSPARALYQKLGYREAGVVSCTFNGLADVQLVCLEKTLPA